MNFRQNLILFFLCIAARPLSAQQAANPKTALLLGRWEVRSYSEQGVPMDKKQAARPQVAVYEHIRRQLALGWYGYIDYEDLSRRESRAS